MDSNFERNVFVNCPYEEQYRPYLHVIIFTLRACGFVPLLVSMNEDSGELRMQKLHELILKSKYSIHDISRCKSQKKGEWYRMNMPYEMGIDCGCRAFAGEPYQDKKFLYLTAEPYSHQKSLSDIAGNDPKCYNNSANDLVDVIRKFIFSCGADDVRKQLPEKNNIWQDYQRFVTDLLARYGESGLDLSDAEFDYKVNLYMNKL